VKKPETPETPSVMAPILLLESVGEPAQILAEATPENNGVMTVRVPFYVGNAVASIAGFGRKVYFPTGILAETVATGNRRIAAKAPGMTSYARHSHATSKAEVPAGDVIALEIQGSKGFATIAVNGTRWGQDIQALARAQQLRAVSLRTDEMAPNGGYGVMERKVNGELMLEATSLDMAGIDFAPDGAAMPTYGVEVLAAEAAVEPAPIQPPRRNTMDPITLDGLRAENPQIVAEIEAPFRKELETLKSEKAEMIQAEAARKRDQMVESIAAKFPDPATALPALKQLCAEAKSADEVAALAMPLLLENLNQTPPELEVSPADKLRAMFTPGGRGQKIQAEASTINVEKPNVNGFGVPSN